MCMFSSILQLIRLFDFFDDECSLLAIWTPFLLFAQLIRSIHLFLFVFLEPQLLFVVCLYFCSVICVLALFDSIIFYHLYWKQSNSFCLEPAFHSLHVLFVFLSCVLELFTFCLCVFFLLFFRSSRSVMQQSRTMHTKRLHLRQRLLVTPLRDFCLLQPVRARLLELSELSTLPCAFCCAVRAFGSQLVCWSCVGCERVVWQLWWEANWLLCRLQLSNFLWCDCKLIADLDLSFHCSSTLLRCAVSFCVCCSCYPPSLFCFDLQDMQCSSHSMSPQFNHQTQHSARNKQTSTNFASSSRNWIPLQLLQAFLQAIFLLELVIHSRWSSRWEHEFDLDSFESNLRTLCCLCLTLVFRARRCTEWMCCFVCSCRNLEQHLQSFQL